MWQAMAFIGSVGTLGGFSVALVVALLWRRDTARVGELRLQVANLEDARQEALSALEAMEARAAALDLAYTEAGKIIAERDAVLTELAAKNPDLAGQLWDQPQRLPPVPPVAGRGK